MGLAATAEAPEHKLAHIRSVPAVAYSRDVLEGPLAWQVPRWSPKKHFGVPAPSSSSADLAREPAVHSILLTLLAAAFHVALHQGGPTPGLHHRALHARLALQISL